MEEKDKLPPSLMPNNNLNQSTSVYSRTHEFASILMALLENMSDIVLYSKFNSWGFKLV